MRLGGGVEPHGVRPRDRHQALADPVHPRHDPPVREAHAQGRAHLDAAAEPLHDAHQLRGAVARGHEIGHADGTARRLPLRLQDQGVSAIAAPYGGGGLLLVGVGGAQSPEAVLLGAEQSGEDRRGVEAGQAQPVDCAVPADQGGGLHVSDECVVLDAPGHVHLQSNGHVAPSAGTLDLRSKGWCRAVFSGRRTWSYRVPSHPVGPPPPLWGATRPTLLGGECPSRIRRTSKIRPPDGTTRELRTSDRGMSRSDDGNPASPVRAPPSSGPVGSRSRTAPRHRP